MNPCDIGTLTQKCLLAQKLKALNQRQNELLPLYVLLLQETGKCVSSGADSDFFSLGCGLAYSFCLTRI